MWLIGRCVYVFVCRAGKGRCNVLFFALLKIFLVKLGDECNGSVYGCTCVLRRVCELQ